MRLLAKTFEGLEKVLASEIKQNGGHHIECLTRAVLFEGDMEVLYKCNALCRTALRILEIKKETRVHDEDHLYKVIYRIPWEGLMELTDTFAVDCTTSGEVFTHSQYAGFKVKDAIVDRFRDLTGKRPSVNIATPTYRINVHIREKTMTLSLDASGESLHKRGYRVTTVDAPLNEVMAAGLVLLSEWDGKTDFLDPMCGGGTIATEAALFAHNIPPQPKDRIYGFKKWKNFNAELWKEIENKYYDKPANNNVKIIASDKSLRASKVTQQNIDYAGLTGKIIAEKADFFRHNREGSYHIIMNPPYDERLKVDNINKFYTDIGDKLKQDYHGSTAWIFSGNVEALKSVGLKPNKKLWLMNGPIESRFYKYTLYKGYGDE